jgi:hypothetical protein
MKKIGMIGGLAWPSTIEYYRGLCMTGTTMWCAWLAPNYRWLFLNTRILLFLRRMECGLSILRRFT